MGQSHTPAASREDGASLCGAPSPFAVVALDIGGTKIAGAVVRYPDRSACPEVMVCRQVATEAAQGGARVLERASALAGELLAAARDVEGVGCTRVVGIGVGTAGRVDAATGSIAFANDIMPGWTGCPLAERLRADHGVPAAVLNDVQAYALGEARFGAAAGAQTCIMVAVGTGLGGALITQGKVLRGAHGFAGELGHTMNELAAGIVCACGGTGHLESVAAGSGIEACYRALGGEALSGVEISARANAGEPAAVRVIEQAGRALGLSIAGWANMIDPERVIVSGSVANAGRLWRDALMAGFLSQATPEQRDLPIVEGELGSRAPLLGAAENLLDEVGC